MTHWPVLVGIGSIVVGLVWIVRRDVPYGFRGGPTLGHLRGRGAVAAGAVAIVLGIGIAYPSCSEFYEVDVCLDGGGAWDRNADECVWK